MKRPTRISLKRASSLKRRDHDNIVSFGVSPSPSEGDIMWQVEVYSRSSEMAEWYKEGVVEATHADLDRYLTNIRYQYYVMTPSFIKKHSFIRIDNMFLGINDYDYQTKTLSVVNLSCGNRENQQINLLELVCKIDLHRVKFFTTDSVVRFYEDTNVIVFAMGRNVLKYPENARIFRNIDINNGDELNPGQPWSMFADDRKGNANEDELTEVFDELTISNLHTLDLHKVQL